MEFSRERTGVGCHFLLQGIFPSQGSNLGLPRCRQTLYCLSHQGIPCDLNIDCMNDNKLSKILKETGIPDHLTSLQRNLYADQEATELDMEQRTGSKLGKVYLKGIFATLLI